VIEAPPSTARIALVCAASKGLGRASAEALARDGVRVAICARGGEALAATAAAMNAAGAGVLPIQADLRRAEDVTRAIETTVAAFGGLDILVTNTGGPPSGPFMTIDEAAWVDAIDSLLLSVVRLCRGTIPHMQARGGGRIINITSISVKQPIEGLVLSNSLRAAVTGLAKTLSVELAPHNILVNCVAPGYTRTDRVVELANAIAAREGMTAEQAEQRIIDKVPLGRLGTPDEFGEVVRFLASPAASYVSGTTIQVDGGWARGLL
jgi:3-oxoacyl-[acyl-carrier protein] reductase